MDRSERFHKIIRLLKDRKVVSRDAFLEALEVSRATFKRDLEYLRDRMDAPILWDAEAGGYRLATASGAPQNYELPGLWLNAGELYALLAMEQLLGACSRACWARMCNPARPDPAPHRGRAIIRPRRWASGSACSRSAAGRSSPSASRRSPRRSCPARLRIRHYSRVRTEATERVVSPQRLVHYRDNWYLDAWCHDRQALRTFSADVIEEAELLERGAGGHRGQARPPPRRRASASSPARAPSLPCCSSRRHAHAGWRARLASGAGGQFQLDGSYTCSRSPTAIRGNW
jgi:predicted DNA-binding transcriptional regulator YafY